MVYSFIKKITFVVLIFTLTAVIKGIENYPLNIVIVLDNGAEYVKDKQEGFGLTMVFDLQNAIDENVPFLSNSSILVNIKSQGSVFGFATTFNKLTSDKWVLYTNQTSEFIIGIPKSYVSSLDFKNPKNLSAIGLNTNVLQRIMPDALTKILDERQNNFDKALLTNPKVTLEPFNLEHLKKIFFNPAARKRIFLIGHGLFAGKLLEEKLKEQASMIKAIIAGMRVDDFQKFLEFLNTIGTDFLYVSSCYSGGYNSLQGFQKQSDEIAMKPLSLNYFVIVGALTDEATRGGTLKFGEFFKALNKFFTPSTTLKDPFTEILKPVSNKLIQNLPSLRYPGSANYQKVIDVDKKTEIITYATATAAAIEKKPKMIKNKEAILLYPIEIKVPLKIEGDIPQLISMIPGHAFHILKEIDIPAKIDDLIRKMFLFFVLPTERIFLLDQLSVNNFTGSGLPNGILTNVMIHKKPMKWGGIIIGKVGNQFYKADLNYDRTTGNLTQIIFNPIEQNAAQNIIQDAVLKIKVEPEAVKQASGGQESLESLRKQAIKKFAK